MSNFHGKKALDKLVMLKLQTILVMLVMKKD